MNYYEIKKHGLDSAIKRWTKIVVGEFKPDDSDDKEFCKNENLYIGTISTKCPCCASSEYVQYKNDDKESLCCDYCIIDEAAKDGVVTNSNGKHCLDSLVCGDYATGLIDLIRIKSWMEIEHKKRGHKNG